MAHNNKEIEIQVQLDNQQVLIDFLETNAKFLSEKHQVDEYFSPLKNNFLNTRPVNEWLRLRDADDKYSINYKNWYKDKEGKTQFCDEFETAMSDLSEAKKILIALDFKSIAVVDKTRRIWIYQDFEIAIDTVKNLGNFVEIEYIGKDEKVDPKNTTNKMIRFLKEVGCKKIIRNYSGYPFQLLFPDEIKYEEY